MNIDFERQDRLLNKAEFLIKENKNDEALVVFRNLFNNDSNYIHAVILTESNYEYRMHSKELNDLLYKYYIDVLTANINKNIGLQN